MTTSVPLLSSLPSSFTDCTAVSAVAPCAADAKSLAFLPESVRFPLVSNPAKLPDVAPDTLSVLPPRASNTAPDVTRFPLFSVGAESSVPDIPESVKLPVASSPARFPTAEGSALSALPDRSMLTVLSVTVSGISSTLTVSITLTSEPSSMPASFSFSAVV